MRLRRCYSYKSLLREGATSPQKPKLQSAQKPDSEGGSPPPSQVPEQSFLMLPGFHSSRRKWHPRVYWANDKCMLACAFTCSLRCSLSSLEQTL